MKTNLISICIPYRNSPEYLDDLFASIKQQTYKNYEIVVCDDQSTKENRELLEKKLSDYFSNYSVVLGIGKGLFLARQVAMKAAKGDIILNADADDMYLGNGLFEYINTVFNYTNCEILMFNGSNSKKKYIRYEKLNKESLDMALENDVISMKQKLTSNSILCNSEKFKELDLKILSILGCSIQDNELLIREALNERTDHYVWEKAISSSIVKNLIIDDVDNITMAEDRLYSLLIFLCSDKILQTNIVGYYYRQNSLSFTHRDNPIDVCGLNIITERRIANIMANYPEYKHNYAGAWLCYVYFGILKLAKNKNEFIKEAKRIKKFDDYEKIKMEYSSVYGMFLDSIKLFCFNYLFQEKYSKLYFFVKHKQLYILYRAIILSRFIPSGIRETRKVYIPKLGKCKFVRAKNIKH